MLIMSQDKDLVVNVDNVTVIGISQDDPKEEPTIPGLPKEDDPKEDPTEKPTEDPTDKPTDDPTDDPTEDPTDPTDPITNLISDNTTETDIKTQ